MTAPTEAPALLFFGRRWDAPIVQCATAAATPAGQNCYDCAEPVVDGDRGFLRFVVGQVLDDKVIATVEPVHAECDLRAVMGHTLKLCGCHGHPHGRETARLVWAKVFGPDE